MTAELGEKIPRESSFSLDGDAARVNAIQQTRGRENFKVAVTWRLNHYLGLLCELDYIRLSAGMYSYFYSNLYILIQR